MALKALFSVMKKEGYVIKDLDVYLLGLNSVDEDRAVDVNSPSQAGTCLRSRYYSRIGATRDEMSIDPRTRRIFDNGHKTHDRLQGYLLDQGMLIMDEIPVFNEDYQIQGHTDGLLKLTSTEKGVLEIKSINSRGFNSLKSAREDHIRQGLIYVFCIEERRKYLREKYKTKEEFEKSLDDRMMEYEKLYPHIKSGRKYSKEEKIMYLCLRHARMDSILYETKVPVTKAVFLYENKDTQDLKEYTVSSTEPSSKVILAEVLEEMDVLNAHIRDDEVPERPVNNPSDSLCRWCSFTSVCWED